jgi:phthiocerol/phenolphthiocerol synthesis type-I polyketide synthase E
MAELAARLEQLSPERRRLLAQLLDARKARPTAGCAGEWQSVNGAEVPTTPEKEECRRFYDGINQQLDASVYGPFSVFLNLGYAPKGPSESPVELPERYLNENSVRLVLEVIGSCDLRGRRVVDVGCGRGGTVSVITQFCKPASVLGVDLSPAAIAFCRAAHHQPNVRFEVGDAEELQLPDASVDVVLNLESSSTYPDVFAFFRQVVRVLAPAGQFLYTDALPVARFAACSAFLRRLRLTLEGDRDITPNVLKSCDDIARQHRQSYEGESGGRGLDDFLAMPGSTYYEAMKCGDWTYRIQRWKKGGLLG